VNFPFLRDQTVIFGVMPDPQPNHRFFVANPQSTILNASANGPIPTDLLEVLGRVKRISLQELEVLVSNSPNVLGKLIIGLPKLLGSLVNHGL